MSTIREIPTYACVRTKTPADWADLLVFDETTGERLDDVIEINTAEGWLVGYVRDDGRLCLDPTTGEKMTERVDGRFRLEWRDEGTTK